jgi:hypothetical protein
MPTHRMGNRAKPRRTPANCRPQNGTEDVLVTTTARTAANFPQENQLVGAITVLLVTTMTDRSFGFVRVRKRKLMGAGGWLGGLAMSSASFDVVMAVRVDGKPRHKFVLSFGSQKDTDRKDNIDLFWFWVHATDRMIRHGLTRAQRQRLSPNLSARARGCRQLQRCKSMVQINACRT